MNMQQLMMQAQKMQREMKKAKDALAAQEFKVTKGGAVTVTLLGNKTVKAIEIDDEAFNPEDKEMIQDMIGMAINEAMENIEAAEEEINERITGQKGGMMGF